MVAALTLSPSALSTGMLSPVRAASFTALLPSMTMPSTGMLSPGRTTKTSPGCTSSMSTSTSAPSRSSTAVLGASRIRLFKASVVLPLLRASSILPMVISAGIMAADSKYSWPWYRSISAMLSAPPVTMPHISKKTKVLQAKDTEEPRATSVSMLGARCIRLPKPLVKNLWLMIITAAASSS